MWDEKAKNQATSPGTASVSQVAKGQTPGQQRATGLHHSWPKHDVSLYLWPNKSDVITERMAEIIFEHRGRVILSSSTAEEVPAGLLRFHPQLQTSGWAGLYLPGFEREEDFPQSVAWSPLPSRPIDSQSNPIAPESLRKEENVAQKVRNQIALNSARH